MRDGLPTGTVTFLFTDVEGSTRLLHELGAGGYAGALAEHRRILRGAFDAHGGVEVDTQGDAFFIAFPTAPRALQAATDARAGLQGGPISVRIGLHTGTPLVTEEGYVGEDVHRAARIAACGHGGQVLVSTSTAALVDSEILHDLGEHRLKDLSAPERIYQLGTWEFPALKSLYHTNLPIPATPFLGREQELADVRALLTRDDVRLLTLTGPGGTGKTRLGLQTAGALAEHYPQGVWWVPLAALRDPELVLEGASQTLGAKDGLAEHIADKHLLLLFDNFEHLVEAAPELSDLLAACPNLDLLVTSREPLHVSGEQEYPVPPLVHEEGVGFFLARARAVTPDFRSDDAVSEICLRLDDLPLALELAAARVKALSSQQILERLEQRLPLLTGGARDLPERQRTLRATIEWSFDLLYEDEQRLFARLALFRGGCTLEAAEDIVTADLDTLQSLVDKSLVRHSSERYWMLKTIHEFAAERLEEAREVEELRRRHAQFFLELAEETEPSLVGASAGDALALLDRDVENLRAALAWASAGRVLELGLQLAASLRDYWFVRGSFTEGIRWLDLLLAGDETADATHRPRALETAATLAIKSGDVAAAGRYAEKALTLAREAHDSATIARSLLILTNAARIRGQAERRDAFLGEGLGLAREMGERVLIARFLIVFGIVSLDAGELDHATRFVSEALALSEEAGDEQSIARASTMLGSIALCDGRVADAQALLRRALIIARRLRFMEAILCSLSMLSYAYAELGQTERAAKLYGAASHLVEVIRLRLDPHVLELQERAGAQIRRSLSTERIDHLFAEGRAMSVDEAVALALEEVESDA